MLCKILSLKQAMNRFVSAHPRNASNHTVKLVKIMRLSLGSLDAMRSESIEMKGLQGEIDDGRDVIQPSK